jgi:hypothetical protein
MTQYEPGLTETAGGSITVGKKLKENFPNLYLKVS